MDVRYLSRAIKAINTHYKISHPDPVFNDALECAAYHLNTLGINLFHSSIVEYEKRAPKLELVYSNQTYGPTTVVVGVQETYTLSQDPVVYDTTVDSCSCRRFLKKGICLHMIYIRKSCSMPVFETSMFLHGRLLKDLTIYEHELAGSQPLPSEENPLDPVDSEMYACDMIPSKTTPSSDKDKWIVANEITKEITENVARYNGEQFENACGLLKAVETLTRTNMFSKEMTEFLANPENFILKKKSLLDTSQMYQLDQQMEWYKSNVLSSNPPAQYQQVEVAVPSAPTPILPVSSSIWPRSPFPAPSNQRRRHVTFRTPVSQSHINSVLSSTSQESSVQGYIYPSSSPLVSG